MALLPQHQKLIDASKIPADVAEARGYRSVARKSELRALGFSETQSRTPALLLPIWNVHGEIGGYQLRPDSPRIRDGKPIKYETPSGTAMLLDVPPGAREWLQDPMRPLFITEGIRKADSAVAAGMCCVALLGVWNWRGSNELGGRVAIPDWENVALNVRQVFLVFDSDVTVKRAVYSALSRLKAYLESRGAEVLVCYLPAGEGQRKMGLDDYLAAGNRPRDVISLAETELRPLSTADGEPPGADLTDGRYEDTPGGLVWIQMTRDGVPMRRQLTNFRAWITADVRQDDGEEITAAMEIEAHRNGWKERFVITAAEFQRMEWPYKHLGAEAAIWPGNGIQDRARHAIKMLSIPIPRRTVYTHLGWRKADGEWVYLHTGGAIGADGYLDDVEVDPPKGLELYKLPAPPDLSEKEGRQAAQDAVRKSLGFLDIAPHEQTWPLLAAVYTAPLATLLPCDFTLWVYGESGGRKSTAAGLALAHFGPEFCRYNLPANFISTGNAVEGQAFSAKDALLVVDDYAPAPDAKQAAAQEAVCHRLLRSVGDTRGRMRATISGQVQGTKAPRCLALATAEGPPPGSQSSEARTLEVHWLKPPVDLEALAAKEELDREQYALAMAGYLRYLAPQIERLKADLPALVRGTRMKMPGAHGRVQESAAKLYAGAGAFLSYAVAIKAITPEQRVQYLEELAGILGRCAENTGTHQAERRPTKLFLEYLLAILAQGQGYLADIDTGEPPAETPGRWGYGPPREKNTIPEPRPGAEKLGWVDLERRWICLIPAAVHRAITRYAQGANVQFPATQRALGEALDQEGLLIVKTKGRRDYNIRAEGAKQWCWILALDVTEADGDPELCPEPDPEPPTEPPTEPPAEEGTDRTEPGSVRLQGKHADHRMEGRGEKTGGFGGIGGNDSGPNNPASATVPNGEKHDGDRSLDSGSNCLQNDSETGTKPARFGGSRGAASSSGTSSGAEVVPETGAPAAAARHEKGPKKGPASNASNASSSRTPTPIYEGAYSVLKSARELPALLEALAPAERIGVDCETAARPGRDRKEALNPKRGRVRLLSLATPRGGWLLDLFHLDPRALLGERGLFSLLGEKRITGHNLYFDLGFLWELGFIPGRTECNYLRSRLLTAGLDLPKGYNGLAPVLERELGIKLAKGHQKDQWGAGDLTPLQLRYAADDSRYLLHVADRFEDQLSEAGMAKVLAIEERCLPCVAWVAHNGVPFDAEAWAALATTAEAELAQRLAELDALAPMPQDVLEDTWQGWRWGSPDICRRALREAGIDLPDTRDETLAAVDHPLAAALRRWRKADKKVSSYGRAWLDLVLDGRLYPELKQLGSRAGRMSMAEPCVGQMPRAKPYRRCIAARPGYRLVKSDYAQIELRIAAYVSGDEQLLQAFREGVDVHRLTALQILGRPFSSPEEEAEMRQRGKPTNFGLIYGMQAAGLVAYALSEYELEMSLADAQLYHSNYFRFYRGIARWHARERARRAEETRTLAGRRRILPPGTPDTHRFNSPIQGTGADGFKRAAALLWERRHEVPGARLVILNHDEVVTECPEGQEAAVQAWHERAMLDGMAPLIQPVPVKVDHQVGPTWGGEREEKKAA